MQRDTMEIQVGLQRATIRIPILAVVEDDISFGEDGIARRGQRDRDHPVSKSVPVDRVREENGVVAVAVSGRKRRANDGCKLHVSEVSVPSIERVRGGLIEGTESVLQRPRPAERKMHHDRAVQSPLLAFQTERASDAASEDDGEQQDTELDGGETSTAEHGEDYALGNEGTRRSWNRLS